MYSGSPASSHEELLEYYGLDAKSIYRKIRRQRENRKYSRIGTIYRTGGGRLQSKEGICK